MTEGEKHILTKYDNMTILCGNIKQSERHSNSEKVTNLITSLSTWQCLWCSWMLQQISVFVVVAFCMLNCSTKHIQLINKSLVLIFKFFQMLIIQMGVVRSYMQCSSTSRASFRCIITKGDLHYKRYT